MTGRMKSRPVLAVQRGSRSPGEKRVLQLRRGGRREQSVTDPDFDVIDALSGTDDGSTDEGGKGVGREVGSRAASVAHLHELLRPQTSSSWQERMVDQGARQEVRMEK